jgi:D-alanine transaminase
MGRIAYVNGQYVEHRRAAVEWLDRGYQFADGVYEVCALRRGRLLDLAPHLDRLERSLAAIAIPMPVARAALVMILREVVRRNRLRDGLVYLQVTRGVAPRGHAFPEPPVPPALVVTARPLSPSALDRTAAGVSVITLPETRWARCDIKSIALLPNVLAKQAAAEQGAFEAWFVDHDGFVTEGSSSNAWIVDAEGRLRTRDLGHAILAGITRAAVRELAARAGLPVVERPFTVAEAKSAREAFLTSATSFVAPVLRIDGAPVGNGGPGLVAQALRQLYLERVESAAEDAPMSRRRPPT